MKQGLAIVAAWVMTVVGCGTALAQSNDFETFRKNAKAEFDQYRQKTREDFEAYRRKINEEFAEFMSKKWERHDPEPAIKPTPLPEPPAPVVKDDDEEPSTDLVPAEGVKPAPAPVEPPQPPVPIPEPVKPVKPSFSFDFYGRRCEVPLESSHRFKLADANEKAVSEAWKRLSGSAYDPVISACLDLRTRLNLCDWAYFRMLEEMTTTFFPSSQRDEARLMQMYLLTQSGYKVRIGRVKGKLVLFLPSEENIFDYSYVTMGKEKLYMLDKTAGGAGIFLFDAKYPGEQNLSLLINRLPDLPIASTEKRTLKSTRCADASAVVSENKNLIDFLDDYPRYDNWNLFSRASMSDSAKEQLYPSLRKAIEGKSQRAAANVLLQWVQTAFEYKTDDQQFGMERPLYADETLYYPYCDCEDRAILYTILVKELLGLDAVLLHYPGHLASAVAFTDKVTGDFVEVDGKRYTVCDPTYINSNVGDTMPMFKGSGVTVVKI